MADANIRIDLEPAEKAKSPIEDELMTLDRRVVQLFDAIERLAHHLTPVLNPTSLGLAEGETPAREKRSELADNISGLSLAVGRAVDQIHMISARCEL